MIDQQTMTYDVIPINGEAKDDNSGTRTAPVHRASAPKPPPPPPRSRSIPDIYGADADADVTLPKHVSFAKAPVTTHVYETESEYGGSIGPAGCRKMVAKPEQTGIKTHVEPVQEETDSSKQPAQAIQQTHNFERLNFGIELVEAVGERDGRGDDDSTVSLVSNDRSSSTDELSNKKSSLPVPSYDEVVNEVKRKLALRYKN